MLTGPVARRSKSPRGQRFTRRSGMATMLAFVFAATTAAFLIFLPLLFDFQDAVASLVEETGRETEELASLRVREAALSEMARGATMPPVCANPSGAKASDCAVFAEPLPYVVPWEQGGDPLDPLTLNVADNPEPPHRYNAVSFFNAAALLLQDPLASVQHLRTPVDKSEIPLCFVSKMGNSASPALVDLALRCLVWVPPSNGYGRVQGATRDSSGLLIMQTYRSVPLSDDAEPEFDISAAGLIDEVVMDGIAAFRMFWSDGGGGWVQGSDVVNPLLWSSAEQRKRMACAHVCIPAAKPTTEEAARTHAENYGLRRVLMFMCPIDSPDRMGVDASGNMIVLYGGNGTGDCVDALLRGGASRSQPRSQWGHTLTPADMEAAFAEAGVSPHRYELVF